MFCLNCGAEFQANANYCASCGSSKNTGAVVTGDETGEGCKQMADSAELPLIGEILYVWRRVVLPPEYQKPVPDNLSWMLIAVDIVFTERHILVIAAPGKSRLAKLASATDSKGLGLAMLFGLAGLAVTITAAMYSSIYDSLYEKTNRLQQEALNKLFREGLVVFAHKDQLECKAAIFSTMFGWAKEYVLHITGNFTSRDGSSKITLSLFDSSSFGGPHLVRPGLDASGFDVGDIGSKLTLLLLKKKH